MARTATGAPPAPTLPLDEAYERALARSPEVELLQLRIEDAEANVRRAWAILKPQWTASYTFTHVEPTPPQISFPNLTSDDVVDSCRQGGDPVACITALQRSLEDPIVLDLSQGDTHLIGSRITWSPLNGRAIPTINNAYDAVEAERDRTQSQRDRIVLAVARAYYAAAATHAAIAAAERGVDRTKKQLDLALARADVGEGSNFALESAKSVARQAVLDLGRAQIAHRQTLQALWTVTYSDDHPDVVDPPPPERPTGTREELLAAAASQRKDLAAAVKTIEIAERAKDEVWWRLAPVVGVFGGYRYSNVRGIGGQNNQWSVGVAATMQLYDGGLRYGDLAAADSRIRSALATRRSLEQRMKDEVERALLRLDRADLDIERAQEAVRIAGLTLDVAEAQYEVGTIREIALTEANDRVRDADLALIRAQMDRAVATIELRHAIGLR